VAPETMPDSDVRAHVHPADSARNPGNPGGSGPESASARASPDARVIPINRQARQEQPQNPPPAPPRAPGGLTAEARAAQGALRAAAENSDWAAMPMTPVAAWSQVAPSKGEAANWIIWVGMTGAGIARAVLVSLGHLIAHGGQTRLRAGVAAGVLVLALSISFLAGHTG
jgi:hypothetical protein